MTADGIGAPVSGPPGCVGFGRFCGGPGGSSWLLMRGVGVPCGRRSVLSSPVLSRPNCGQEKKLFTVWILDAGSRASDVLGAGSSVGPSRSLICGKGAFSLGGDGGKGSGLSSTFGSSLCRNRKLFMLL